MKTITQAHDAARARVGELTGQLFDLSMQYYTAEITRADGTTLLVRLGDYLRVKPGCLELGAKKKEQPVLKEEETNGSGEAEGKSSPQTKVRKEGDHLTGSAI